MENLQKEDYLEAFRLLSLSAEQEYTPAQLELDSLDFE